MPVKKRYVTGLNEVCKHLKAGNLTMVIIATDLEKVEEEGGIDEVIATIAHTCQKAKVPLVYNLTRTRLGCLAKQKGQSVSAVGVQNFQGANEEYKNLSELTAILREQFYQNLAESVEKEE